MNSRLPMKKIWIILTQPALARFDLPIHGIKEAEFNSAQVRRQTAPLVAGDAQNGVALPYIKSDARIDALAALMQCKSCCIRKVGINIKNVRPSPNPGIVM